MRTHPFDRRRAARRQRGAALLTAMIIVTLVATLAASMVWQQWRAVQVESAERARVQAAWILSGALDWARLILREDQKSARGTTVTALGEVWSTELKEARISTFLAVDKNNADDGPEAFLSGQITDAQARYNLTNLPSQGKVDPLELETLERLCQTVGIESGVALRIATGLVAASGVGTSVQTTAAAPLMPRSVDQLGWLGIDAASVKALSPFVVLLPQATPVNVNTASREVLAAVIKGLDLGTAERLIQVRQRKAFKDLQEFSAQLSAPPAATAKLAVHSSYFEVRGRVRLVDRVLTERSLVRRLPNLQIDVLQRDRVASVEQSSS
jgi:general secretion pathway protein K